MKPRIFGFIAVMLLSIGFMAETAAASNFYYFAVPYFGTTTDVPGNGGTNTYGTVSLSYPGTSTAPLTNGGTPVTQKISSTSNSLSIQITPNTGYKVAAISEISGRINGSNSMCAEPTASDSGWSARSLSDVHSDGSFSYALTINNPTKNNSSSYFIRVVFAPIVTTVSFTPYIVDDTPLNSALTHCSATGVIKLSGVTVATAPTISSGYGPLGTTNTVMIGSSATYTIDNTSALCTLDSVAFNSVSRPPASADLLPQPGATLPYSYTTDAATSAAGDADVAVKFKHKGYTLTIVNDPSGNTACGSVSPTPGTGVTFEAGSSQLFTAVVNTNCAIASVTVLDPGGSYSSTTDITASFVTGGNSYQFSNISANGTLSVRFVQVSTTLGGQYCQVPAYVAGHSTLKPNALLILDNSGSMGDYPYSAAGSYPACTSASTLLNCTNYYGYFDPGTMYKRDPANSNKYLIDSTTTLNLAPVSLTSGITTATRWSGNQLNYAYMQKIDIIRKILIGGLVQTGTGYRARYTSDLVVTYFVRTQGTTGSGAKPSIIVQQTVVEPSGLIQQSYDKMRFGIMSFNNNSAEVGSDDGGYISAQLGSSLPALIAVLEGPDTTPNGSTPLAESLYEAVRYYQAGYSAYNKVGSAFVNYGDTTQFTEPVQATCQKHFVLLLTDGQPTNDQNLPGNPDVTENVADAKFNAGTWYSKMDAADQLTGSTTGNTGGTIRKFLLPAVAYYAHTTDLRSSSNGKNDIAGTQNLTIYSVFAFGDSTGGAVLKATGKYGAFTDTNQDGKPEAGEYVAASGTTTTSTGFYPAQQGDVLASNLASVFSTILSSTASGTAAAVANNRSGERGANMVQALFYPQWPTDKTVAWTGEVQAMWFYLSPLMSNTTLYEDTDGNKELNPMIDKQPSSNPFAVKALWRAGAKLQQTSAASRHIYTMLNSSAALTAAANSFDATNVVTLKADAMMNINALANVDASNLINYVRGVDNSLYRPRVVSFADPLTGAVTTDVWKLGDIIDSTPQVESNIALNGYQTAYGDASYAQFTGGSQYQARNMVFVGANDGMLHAFRLGLVSSISDSTAPSRIAKMTDADGSLSNLGEEEWSFIPKNAVPYLQHQAGTAYCHQDLVDGSSTLVDVSVFNGDCTEAHYWDCTRKTTLSGSSVDTTKTTWGTVLIGSMGLGGASRDAASNCNETTSHDGDPTNNTDCVKTPKTGNGLSSYFALNVTNPQSPAFMWEFSDYSIAAPADKGLGFTTAGSAVVRINSLAKTGATMPVHSTNGRWFAVFASGPTGAIAASTFSGHSDQNLKLYIVNLNGGSTFNKCSSAGATNCNYWVKDTGIPFAFANSITGTSIDLDRWNQQKDGNYSDDLIYITYTKANLDSSGYPANSRTPVNVGDIVSPWDKGGVLRLVTNHNPDPFTWFTSLLIDNTGPITSAVGRLQDRNSPSQWRAPALGNLWVYFGEGRFYQPGDDLSATRKFYGVSDPCYNQYAGNSSGTYTLYSGDNASQYALGTNAATCPSVSLSDLVDQTSTITATSTNTLPNTYKGWYVSMSAATNGSTASEKGSERVLTDVRADTNGIVYFTTFTPNTDVCVPGGTTSMWAVKYDNGGTPPAASLVGKTPVQTSGGGITMLNTSSVFKLNNNRKLDGSIVITNSDGTTSTLDQSLGGIASRDRGNSIGSNPARRKILHSQEH